MRDSAEISGTSINRSTVDRWKSVARSGVWTSVMVVFGGCTTGRLESFPLMMTRCEVAEVTGGADQALAKVMQPNAIGINSSGQRIGRTGDRCCKFQAATAIREGGGVDDWLWNGATESPVAELEVVVNYPEGYLPLFHRMSFTIVGQQRLDAER